MSENRLELKIITDSNNNETDLAAMSLAEAKAFVIMIEAVTKIVEFTPNNENLTIEIKKGSACVIAHGDNLTHIDALLDEILTNKSNDKLVEPLRQLQTLFLNNGLHYEGKLEIGVNVRPIYNMLREAKKIKKYSVHRPAIQTSIVFPVGKLLAVGGKIPNIHIETGDLRIPIGCTENNANKAKYFLYKDISLSAWVKDNGETKRFEMCDSYFDTQQDLFIDFQNFIQDFSNAENEIESLKKLHFKCREFLDKKEYGNFRKFLRLFNHESTDVNTLKTILIITQSFKHNEKLQELRKSLKEHFDKKINSYRKNKHKN
jgi:hypothetical protein